MGNEAGPAGSTKFYSFTNLAVTNNGWPVESTAALQLHFDADHGAPDQPIISFAVKFYFWLRVMRSRARRHNLQYAAKMQTAAHRGNFPGGGCGCLPH